MVLIFTGKVSDINSTKTIDTMDDISAAIKIKLDTAKSVHDGYTETFYIPEKIYSQTYNITTIDNYLILTLEDDENKQSITLIPEITGNFTPGKNTIVKNGGIFVN